MRSCASGSARSAVGRRRGDRGPRHRLASSRRTAEVKVFLVADEAVRAHRRTRRASGRGRGVARRGPARPRRARRRQHAARRRRGAARHDRPHRRRGRRAHRRARQASAGEQDRRRLGGRAPDDRRLRCRLLARCASTGRARADARRARRRLEPLQLDRPARARSGEPADALLHGQGRGAPRARAGTAHALVRRVPGAARRVGSRRRSHDARDRQRREMPWACSPRARASARASPGPVQPGAAMVAINEERPARPGRDLRQLRVAARQLQARLRRVGRADDLRRPPARRQGLQGGVASRSSERSASSGSGSGTCTRSAARATRRRRDEAEAHGTQVTAPTGELEAPRAAGRDRGHGRDRRLPERRQVDARQPADRDARRRRPRDARRHARPQGAPLRVVGDDVPAHRHRRRRPGRHRSVRRADRRAGEAGDRGGGPRPLRRRRAGGHHARRRGARRDPPPLAAPGARDREQARRPAPRHARRSSSTVSGSASRFRSPRSTATARATSSTRS